MGEKKPLPKDLEEWGAEVVKLSQNYPNASSMQNTSPAICFKDEEKNWVPTNILKLVNAFRKDYGKSIPTCALRKL